MKYAIEELLTISQDELVEIYEKEEALLSVVYHIVYL